MCNLSEAIVEETEISLIKKLLKEGKTPKEIHDFCGYPLELILEVQKDITK